MYIFNEVISLMMIVDVHGLRNTWRMGKNASGYVREGHFPRNVLPEKINQEREDQNHPINWGTQTEQKGNE